MSYGISGTTITLTRGDTFVAYISITDSNGEEYTPVEGDSIRFAMKSKYSDLNPLLVKDIPIDSLKLELEPDDTKNLPFGKYVYDIQLTKSTGEVDTFITKAIIKITEEVDGQNLVKTFSDDLLNMEAVLTDSSDAELARLKKVFAEDGSNIVSTVTYGG